MYRFPDYPSCLIDQTQTTPPVPRGSGVPASRATGRFRLPVVRAPGPLPRHTMGDTQGAWVRRWRRAWWTRGWEGALCLSSWQHDSTGLHEANGSYPDEDRHKALTSSPLLPLSLHDTGPRAALLLPVLVVKHYWSHALSTTQNWVHLLQRGCRYPVGGSLPRWCSAIRRSVYRSRR